MATRKKVSHAKVVEAMYRDFMRLAGLTPKIIVKKVPAKKKKKAPVVYIPKVTKLVRTPKKVFVHKPPRRKSIPIGGIAHMVSPAKPPPPRESMPVSEHWSYFDKDGNARAPWEIEVGPGYDDDGDVDEEEGMFADEDYSYEDIEADWGGYEHSDTGYGDEDA